MMSQPPWDEKLEPYYILHYTYGMDYTLAGEFTPGEALEACLAVSQGSRSMVERGCHSTPVLQAQVPPHASPLPPCLHPPCSSAVPTRFCLPPTRPRPAGKYGEWRFDKRSYAGKPPPRNLGEPPTGMKNELVRLVLCLTQGLVAAVLKAAVRGWQLCLLRIRLRCLLLVLASPCQGLHHSEATACWAGAAAHLPGSAPLRRCGTSSTPSMRPHPQSQVGAGPSAVRSYAYHPQASGQACMRALGCLDFACMVALGCRPPLVPRHQCCC